MGRRERTTAGLYAAAAPIRGQAAGIIITGRQLGGIIGVGVFSATIAAVPVGTGSPAAPGFVIGFLVAAVLAGGACVTVLRGIPVATKPLG